jgi:hypothetical protein
MSCDSGLFHEVLDELDALLNVTACRKKRVELGSTSKLLRTSAKSALGKVYSIKYREKPGGRVRVLGQSGWNRKTGFSKLRRSPRSDR